MMSQEDSFGSSRAYYINGLGCLHMLYLEYDYKLTPYELMRKYYVYTYTLMWYMQYLSSVTYVILCTGFVFGLEIIYWPCGCSTPSFIYFPPCVNTIDGLQTCILICYPFILCVCTLDWIMQVSSYVSHSWV